MFGPVPEDMDDALPLVPQASGALQQHFPGCASMILCLLLPPT